MQKNNHVPLKNAQIANVLQNSLAGLSLLDILCWEIVLSTEFVRGSLQFIIGVYYNSLSEFATLSKTKNRFGLSKAVSFTFCCVILTVRFFNLSMWLEYNQSVFCSAPHDLV